MVAARLILCAAAVLGLAGCLAPQDGSAPGAPGANAEAQKGLAAFFAGTERSAGTRKKPLAKVTLAGGDVIVSGPDGYCIDPETRSTGAQRGFAVIASCRILSGGKTGPNVSPMMLTVTVGPKGDAQDLPTPEALAEVSEAKLLDWKISGDRVFAHLQSGGSVMFDGADTRYWRGAFLQGDRLVGLALYAPRGSDLSGKGGATMLARVKDGIARQSGSARPVTAAEPKRTGGFLSRLINN